MNNIMLPVEFMKYGYILVPVLLLFHIITISTRFQAVKAAMHILKAVAYMGLAIFMWVYYKDLEQIDVISAFTFIFCCFEAIDNIFSFISLPVDQARQRMDRYNERMENLDMIQRLRK